MDTVWQEFRQSVRRLAKSPGFTSVVVLTLALGIGANTAIFSVINSVLLRPLLYPDSERLVMIWGRFPRLGIQELRASEPEVVDFRANIKAFSYIAAFIPQDLILASGDEPEMVSAAAVESQLFPLLGVQPLVGRAFTAEEDRPGSLVAVLSHSLWRRRFGSDPGVVGRSVLINDRSYTVLGVMPPSFQFPSTAEIWVPLAIDSTKLMDRGEHDLNLIARVRPDLTVERAQAELTAFGDAMQKEHPIYYPPASGWALSLVPLQYQVVGNIRPALLMLLGSVGFVLLIACANVSNLLLVRAQIQEREISVRVALGASRGRLLRQFFTESLVLSLLGASLGLLVASWGVRILAVTHADSLPRFQEIRIDAWVLVFTVGVALFTALLIGLIPALRFSRPDLNESLKEGSGKGTGGQAYQRTRSLLVISEMASALVLLVGAGLLIGSLFNLRQVDPGFRADDLLTMRVSLSRTRYPESYHAYSFFQRLLTQARSLPGVESAGLVTHLPFGSNSWNATFFIQGRSPHENGGPLPSANPRAVSADYFQAMGIPLLKGRVLSEQDQEKTLSVAVIDEALAERFWPDEDPLGKRVALMGENNVRAPWMTIVGVVGSVKDAELQAEPDAHLYFPYQQRPMRSMYLAVHTNGKTDPEALTGRIQAIVRDLDRAVPVYETEPMEERLSRSMSKQALTTLLLALFAGVAVMLAAIGLYGVMSYTVLQRRREIGIRMALGAQRGDVLGMVVRQGMALIAIGLAIGLVGAFSLTRLIVNLIYGVQATDPAIYLGAALLLALIALAASYIPARRTTKIDPILALRYE